MKTRIAGKEKLKFTGLAVFVFATIALGHYFGLGDKITMESIRAAIQQAGHWQFHAFALAYCIAALIPAPTALLSTASGAVWGPYLGMVVLVMRLIPIFPWDVVNYLSGQFYIQSDRCISWEAYRQDTCFHRQRSGSSNVRRIVGNAP